jgi:RNA polymerase sigma factor (sigma-70 family)
LRVTAFDAFYREHEPAVRRYAERLVGPAEAPDLVQEVMFRASRQLAGEGFTGSAWPWLSTVTKRLAIDHHRVADRIAYADDQTLDELAAPLDDAPATAAIHADVRRRLGQAMARLSAPERALLTHHEVHGVPVVSMARGLGVNANAVRQRLFRARRSLSHHYRVLGGQELALPALAETRRRVLDPLRPYADGVVQRLGELRQAPRAAAAVAVAALVTTGGPPVATPNPVPPHPGSRPAVAVPALAVAGAVRVAEGAARAARDVATAVAAPLRAADLPAVVEAESGALSTDDCGDVWPMAVEADPLASGRLSVYHGGSGCAQGFATERPRRVTAIRFRTGGRDGDICGHFEVSGALSGTSDPLCVAGGTYALAPVATTAGSGAYTVEWVVEPGEKTWVDVFVDYHVLDTATRAQCANGRDDDGDGRADGADPSCVSGLDDQELAAGACDDGLDNDGDGRADYGADPGCGTYGDPYEQCLLGAARTDVVTSTASGCWTAHPEEAGVLLVSPDST